MICSHVFLSVDTLVLSSIRRTRELFGQRTTHFSSPRGLLARTSPTPRLSLRRASQLSTSYDIAAHVPVAELTPAQLSRAAAQAVRLSTRAHNFADALHIVNSLHMSPPTPTINHHPDSPFQHQVSPRLAAHCFLHALLRSGRARQAARLSETMMKQGLLVRSRTLQSIVAELCRPSRTPSTVGLTTLSFLKRPQNDSEVLKLVSNRVGDPGSQAAIRILEHAREYGHHRSQQMYDILIRACLLQGEIIVASLLFVLLVKEFTAKPARERTLVLDQGPVMPAQDERHRHFALPMLYLILRDVNAVFLHDPRTLDDEQRLHCSLQALANVTMLFEQDEYLSGNLSSVIRTLYSCPKTRSYVWVVRNGESENVLAYPYFQSVLIRIIKRLKIQEGAQRIPPLTVRSYNALLFYSLRHRLSPSLATIILERMSSVREPPLEPTIATYNILLRSATLLRLPHVVDDLLSALHVSALQKVESPVASELASRKRRRPSHQSDSSKYLNPHRLSIPIPLLAAFTCLQPDIFTLTSYIAHLTSIGKPHAVQELLFHLLPELRMIHDDNIPFSANIDLHDLCLKRAVIYGPYFFTVVLNALVKAGSTGMAERVWVLAQRAQQASQTPGFAPDVKPWRLSIHAYTILMQCYAAEASKTSIKSQGSHLERRTSSRVHGFGRFVYSRKQLSAGRQRHLAGYRSGVLLFRTVVYGNQTMSKASMRIGGRTTSVLSTLPLPSPAADDRFYNATLDLVSAGEKARQQGDVPHKRLEGVRSWAHMVAATLRQEVAQSITSSDYALPLSMQKEVKGAVNPDPTRTRLDRSPYAFYRPRKGCGRDRLRVAYTRSIPKSTGACSLHRRRVPTSVKRTRRKDP